MRVSGVAVLALLVLPVLFVAVTSSPEDAVYAGAGTICDATGHCIQFVYVPVSFLKSAKVIIDNGRSVVYDRDDVYRNMVVLTFDVVNGSSLSYKLYAKSDSDESMVFRCSFVFKKVDDVYTTAGGCALESYGGVYVSATVPENSSITSAYINMLIEAVTRG